MSEIESKIESVEHLLSVALRIDHDSEKLYRAASARMRESCNEEQAARFLELADSEKEHAIKIRRMGDALGITNLSESPNVSWKYPHALDNRDLATSPGTSSPYLALAFAVDRKQQAFRYYSYVAANSSDSDVGRYAEILASEELTLAAKFREQRRKAYHMQRSRKKRDKIPLARDIGSIQDLLAAGLRIEKDFYRLLTAVAETGQDVSACMHNTRSIITQLENESSITNIDTPINEIEKPDNLKVVVDTAEQGFFFYSEVVESAQNEDIMLKAQDLARSVLERIQDLDLVQE